MPCTETTGECQVQTDFLEESSPATMAGNQCPFFYRWLHIWKLQLQENVDPEKQMYECCVACGSPHYPHPSRGACLLRPLILGCFRGHVSLLVHHSLVFHAISPIHTLRLTGTERDRLVVMGLSRPSVRSR